MSLPVTKIIDGSERHRLIIGEHPDKCYIAATVDDVSVGGFYTADQAMEAAGTLLAIARRLRKRASA